MYFKIKKRRLVALFSLFIFYNYSTFGQKEIKIDTTGSLTIRIDPGNSSGGNVSDIFSAVKYIPLETTPESIFGSVDQLDIIDDRYVILDQNTNCILFFTKSGKFLNKIKSRIDDPNFKIWKFLINKQTKEIIYFIDNLNTLVYCDLNGKTNKTVKAENQKGNLTRGYFLSGKEFLAYNQYRYIADASKIRDLEKGFLLQYLNSDGSVRAIGFPYNNEESHIDVVNSGIGPLTKFGNDTTLFFSKPYINTIYTVSPNSIKQSYKFVFPLSYSLPIDFAANVKYNGKRFSYIKDNSNLIFNVTNFYNIGNNLIFKANAYKPYKENNLIYNLKHNYLIAYKHISPDESSNFLPIYDDISSNFDNVGISACDGTYLYTSISSLCMFKAKDENVDKKIKYSEVLSKYFDNNTKQSNPVILQLKLKEE